MNSMAIHIIEGTWKEVILVFGILISLRDQ